MMEAGCFPVPISICEIDREREALRVVYRVTGPGTGTRAFFTDEGRRQNSGYRTSGQWLSPGAGGRQTCFSDRRRDRRAARFSELAKQLKCEKKQIVAGYRDKETFLRNEFEQNGELFIATEDGSVGTRGNVMDAIRENGLRADVIYACGPTPMLRALQTYAAENEIRVLSFSGGTHGLRHRCMSCLCMPAQKRKTSQQCKE